MRLITFCTTEKPAPRVGVRVDSRILDLAVAARAAGESAFPDSMKHLLAAGDGALERVRGLIAAVRATPAHFTEALLEERNIRFLPTVPDADKFLCVGKNYRQHLEELRRNDLLTETPQEPTAFVKLNSCLIGHGARVVKPDGTPAAAAIVRATP